MSVRVATAIFLLFFPTTVCLHSRRSELLYGSATAPMMPRLACSRSRTTTLLSSEKPWPSRVLRCCQPQGRAAQRHPERGTRASAQIGCRWRGRHRLPLLLGSRSSGEGYQCQLPNPDWDDSIKLDDILKLLYGARSAAKFIVFDACRNELQLPTKDTTKGLVPVAEQQTMFIACASAPGRTASDRGDKSGPYASISRRA